MPVSVELKYEYFLSWPGRIKLVEVVRMIFDENISLQLHDIA